MFSLLSFLMVLAFDNVHASVVCIGPESVQERVVFFHGKQKQATAPEIQEISVLLKLSLANNIRIAVVASETINRDGEIFWDRTSLSSAEQTFNRSMDKASACWPEKSKTKNVTLMGFSSGGFFLNYLYQHCSLADYNSVISVSASGKFLNDRNCRQNSKLTLLMGKEEGFYFEESRSYSSSLRQSDFNVEFVPFHGDHEFLFEPIDVEIKKKERQGLSQYPES